MDERSRFISYEHSSRKLNQSNIYMVKNDVILSSRMMKEQL